MKTSSLRTFLVAAVALCLGCGGEQPPLLNVGGRVTFQGKPVAKTLVNFLPIDGRPGTALTDADGRFAFVQYTEQRKGVMFGENAIVLSYLPPTPETEFVSGPPAPPPPELQPLFAKYGRFDAPQFKLTVERGMKELEIALP